jgi:hypothetical protein
VQIADPRRVRALLLLQPDFFFGDFGELIERRDPAASGVERLTGFCLVSP